MAKRRQFYKCTLVHMVWKRPRRKKNKQKEIKDFTSRLKTFPTKLSHEECMTGMTFQFYVRIPNHWQLTWSGVLGRQICRVFSKFWKVLPSAKIIPASKKSKESPICSAVICYGKIILKFPINHSCSKFDQDSPFLHFSQV